MLTCASVFLKAVYFNICCSVIGESPRIHVSITVFAFPNYTDPEKPLQICHRAAIQARAISCNDAEQHVSYVYHLSWLLFTTLDPVSGNAIPEYTVGDTLLFVLL